MFRFYQKKQCMYILNDQQMLHLLSEKESRLIEKMDVLSGNFGYKVCYYIEY